MGESDVNILAIDPGGSCTGLAWIKDEDESPTVVSARPTKRSARDKAREIVLSVPELCWDWIVIEIPQVYSDSKQDGDPNDLIKLAVLAGNLQALIPAYKVLEVQPAAWKGQVPKKQHHARLRARTGFRGKASKDAMDALGLLVYGQDLIAANAHARRKRSRR